MAPPIMWQAGGSVSFSPPRHCMTDLLLAARPFSYSFSFLTHCSSLILSKPAMCLLLSLPTSLSIAVVCWWHALHTAPALRLPPHCLSPTCMQHYLPDAPPLSLSSASILLPAHVPSSFSTFTLALAMLHCSGTHSNLLAFCTSFICASASCKSFACHAALSLPATLLVFPLCAFWQHFFFFLHSHCKKH